MADNVSLTTGDGSFKGATDAVTYSGDAGVHVALTREVVVSGAEGSKTVTDKSYNAGAADAGTQRVIHASDDPILAYVDGLEGFMSTLAAASAAVTTQNVNLGTEKLTLNDGTQLTPKFAKVQLSASGELVAAVTGKKIRVLQYKLMANGAVNTKFQGDSGGTPVDLTGLSYFAAAGSGESVGFSPVGLFETASGKNLYLNLSASTAVGGFITYVEV